MEASEAQSLAASFSSLDNLIDTFRAGLSPLGQIELTYPKALKVAFVTHTLAYTAVIQLHAFFSPANAHSQQKSVAAAEAIFALINEVDLSTFGQVNPILGTLWMRACQVLIGEVARLKALRSAWAPDVVGGKEEELGETLERAFEAMAMFSVDSPLMSKCYICLVLQVCSDVVFL